MSRNTPIIAMAVKLLNEAALALEIGSDWNFDEYENAKGKMCSTYELSQKLREHARKLA